MQQILFDYRINPTTWAYLSSLLMIGIYFKFHRFWSVRNLDLVALIGFAPGLLMIYYGMSKGNAGLVGGGYVWMFVVNGFFLIRTLLDPVMVRRPLLEPNLSVSGLTFTGISLLIFLMANVVNTPPERLESVLCKPAEKAEVDLRQASPGYVPFQELAAYSCKTVDETQLDEHEYRRQVVRICAARITAILAHLALVTGLVLVGYRHFDNIHAGVAVGTLYLLFFYTSQMTGQVEHVVPAALLTWTIVAYRRPVIAGIFMGLAAGLIYYPLFLLPLWCGFYWQRGVVRFLLGVVLALAVLIGGLALAAGGLDTFVSQLRLMFGVRYPFDVQSVGFWQFHQPGWRISVLAPFLCLAASLAIWPAQKNLGTLLSCSAAVMIAVQFWHAHQGGIYLAWFLPLLLLTIFRPNLEDRVALSAVRDFRWPRRKGAKQLRAEAAA